MSSEAPVKIDPVVRYGEPVKISPFLKFSRWSFLILGIAYGSLRQSYLQRRADRLKPIRDDRIAKRLEFERLENIRKAKEEIQNLSTILGSKLM